MTSVSPSGCCARGSQGDDRVGGEKSAGDRLLRPAEGPHRDGKRLRIGSVRVHQAMVTPTARRTSQLLLWQKLADPANCGHSVSGRLMQWEAVKPCGKRGSAGGRVLVRRTRQEPFVVTAFMRSFTGFRRKAPMNRGTTNGLGDCLRGWGKAQRCPGLMLLPLSDDTLGRRCALPQLPLLLSRELRHAMVDARTSASRPHRPRRRRSDRSGRRSRPEGCRNASSRGCSARWA